MIPREPQELFGSLDAVAEAILSGYSVGDNAREQYLDQVKQYPLYLAWFDYIESEVERLAPETVTELGPGPGLLAERLSGIKLRYRGVEPHPVFQDMTREVMPVGGMIVADTAENFVDLESDEMIVATAAYHHFRDKPAAIKNVYQTLKPGGILIVADGFIPPYAFDDHYCPEDKAEFVDRVLDYAAAQILSMPNPRAEDIKDQLMTTILDVIRREEFKVSADVLVAQLENAGFVDISDTLMVSGIDGIVDENLGYHIVQARKPY